MNCRAFRNQIEELSPDCFPSDEAHAHAAACVACSDFHRQQLALKKLIQTLEPVCAPHDFDRKLNARLSAAPNALPTRRFFYFNFIPGTVSISFASFFVLAVCAAVLIKETRVPEAPRTDRTPYVAADVPTVTLVLPHNNSSSNKRAGDGNPTLARVLSKSTNIRSPRTSPAAKRTSDFAVLRREEPVPEKEPKVFEATAPLTKSIVFSSSAAPIVTRAVTTNLSEPLTNASKAVSDLSPDVQPDDLFAAGGLKTLPLTPQLAMSLNARGGLLVVSVQPQSAAFRAGLRPSDVIEAANNQLLSGADAHLLQTLKDTADLSLTVVRDNQRLSLTLSLERR